MHSLSHSGVHSKNAFPEATWLLRERASDCSRDVRPIAFDDASTRTATRIVSALTEASVLTSDTPYEPVRLVFPAALADLYHDLPKDYPFDQRINDRQAPAPWKLHYFKRIKDLVDKYQPDLLYTDGDIFFEEYGLALVANLYNISANRHDGRCEAVYNIKLPSDCETGTCVLDWERGVASGIPANPWQTDTCIGDWHYNREAKYKSSKYVIDMLVDILSRNGNLLLNFPLPNSGELDYEELVILDEITNWMAINSEAIYATRPWKTFGDGPVATAPASSGGTRFNEAGRKELTAEEARFTTKGETLYAFIMGWPDKLVLIKSLAITSCASPILCLPLKSTV